MKRTLVSRRGLVAGAGLAALTGLSGCSFGEQTGDSADDSASEATVEEPKKDKVQSLIDSMTLDQKVAQLFIVTPEQLTGVGVAVAAGDATKAALESYPVAGLCYFAQNITGADQLKEMLANTSEFAEQVSAGIKPFLTVDEEGGPLVSRIANSGFFDVATFPDMDQIGASGDTSQAANVGTTIGSYLHEIGFNVDFAPVADVLTNPDNQVIGKRAFSSDANVVSQMVSAEVESMLQTGVLPCVKHFPGHGDTEGDSHTGAVYATRTREQMEACEFLPFKAGIEAGCPLVMVGHIETPNVAADGLPATLSSIMMTDILRGELGFDGVIVSDSFVMGAITESYEPADAAVCYIQAGGDIILMTPDLPAAHQGIMDAVNAGTIAESRIDESLKRILKAKDQAGLLA